jgi:hypothetical protein
MYDENGHHARTRAPFYSAADLSISISVYQHPQNPKAKSCLGNFHNNTTWSWPNDVLLLEIRSPVCEHVIRLLQ